MRESETAVTGQPQNTSSKDQSASRKKLLLFALGLVAVSAFMYGSIIIKTAMMGP
jgi:hypothetical protein